MSDCKNCIEIKSELERLRTDLEQEKQLNAELLVQIEQLKLSAAVAYDPNHVFVDLSEPFDDLHIGQENEEEQELVNQLPTFSTLFKNGELIFEFKEFIVFYLDEFSSHLQNDQKIRYDAFANFKKRLFWYFWCQYESMIAQKLAKSYFAKVSRSVALRIICDLSDINNEPTSPNDCWVANGELVNEERRAQLAFTSKTTP
jgi:hypothetical protein